MAADVVVVGGTVVVGAAVVVGASTIVVDGDGSAVVVGVVAAVVATEASVEQAVTTRDNNATMRTGLLVMAHTPDDRSR